MNRKLASGIITQILFSTKKKGTNTLKNIDESHINYAEKRNEAQKSIYYVNLFT